ncbi:GSTM5 transferase, partial [Motacilla alba]|nr:GSTM5 transferase [Motacilla alba]
APDYDKSQWINEKEKLGLDFPNLPYFIDGPTKLTQSNAILRYIARKHRMCQCGRGLERGWRGIETGTGGGLKRELDTPEGAEGLGRGFVLTVSPRCPQLTFVDFLMFDVLDQNRIFEPKCLEPFKNLKDFVERFGALEKVAAYLKSSRFQKMPINNKMAKWGNK